MSRRRDIDRRRSSPAHGRGRLGRRQRAALEPPCLGARRAPAAKPAHGDGPRAAPAPASSSTWRGARASSTPSIPSPGRPTGGPFKAIETSVSGVRFSEHLPRARAPDEAPGGDPLAHQQGGEPRSRPPPHAHRLPAPGRRRPPRLRLAGGRGARPPRPARLRLDRRPRRGRRLPGRGLLAAPGAEPGQVDPQPDPRPRRRRETLRRARRALALAAGGVRRRRTPARRWPASARSASRPSRSCRPPAPPPSTSPPSPRRSAAPTATRPSARAA